MKTLDIAKRLLDYGFRPPTTYFPLIVDEALMIEPTETETRETLDAFAEAVETILAEAEDDPGIAQGAPYTTPCRRGRRPPPPGGQASRVGAQPSSGSALAELQHRLEQVAPALDPVQDLPGLEEPRPGVVALQGPLHLAPLERRGRGRARAGAQRVDRDGRLAAVVLAPVHQHLAGSQLPGHPGDHPVGVLSSRRATAWANGWVRS